MTGVTEWSSEYSLSLAIVYSQSQSIDLESIHSAQRILIKIEAEESHLERDLLKIHKGDIRHFDSLKHSYNQLVQLQNELSHLISAQNQTNFKQLQQNFEAQTFAIEEFKTNQSILNNSLRYLPTAIAMAIKSSPQNTNQLIKLHRDILLYLNQPSHQLITNIEKSIFSLHLNQSLQRHINHVMHRHNNVLNAISNFARANFSLATQNLGLIMDEQLKNGINNMRRYQLLLVLLSLMLIVYIGWAVWQQTKSSTKLRQALRKIEAQQLALDEHAVVGITNQHGDLTYVNDKFCELSGYSHSELLGKNHRIINSRHHSQSFFQEMWHTITQGKVWHGIVCNQNKSGDHYWVDASIIPFLNDEGKPYQYVSIHTDVTRLVEHEEEQKQLHQKKLKHAQRLESLGVLAGGIAHDFNNLLTAIMGNAGLIDRELDALHPSKDRINRVISASEKAANLCKQMLAYSGKGHFIIQDTDLSLLVEEIAELLLISIDKNVVIKYELAEYLPAIEADVAQIQQVVMNLITNANEAIHGKSGVITLATGWAHVDGLYLKNIYTGDDLVAGDYVFLEVSDNGCGMDENTINKIFDPFFTTKFTGRGLGMSALLGIVRGHKGAIKIYSEVGRGTTFKVLFPVAKQLSEQVQGETKHKKTMWKADGGIVLIVDDEESIREMAGTMLRELGFDILEAENGLEAVKLYPKHAADISLVLLDMSMPKMGGEETFRELRHLNPNVRVILSSGYNEQEATNRFSGKGLAGFVQKPYLPDALQKVVQAAFTSQQ